MYSEADRAQRTNAIGFAEPTLSSAAEDAV